VISNNYIQRIQTQDGTAVWSSGTGLLSNTLSATVGFPASVTFSGNTCILGLSATAEIAVNVKGGRRLNFVGNTVVNPIGGAATNNAVQWSHLALAGWTDPEGLDAAGTMQVRDTMFRANNYVNFSFVGAGGTGSDNVNVVHDMPPIALSQATAPGSQINACEANVFRFTLTGNWGALGIFNGAVNQDIEVSFIQDATGGRTYTWPAVCKFNGGTAPTASTTAGYIDTVRFRFDGTNWNELSRAIGIH
jgi:hypothetical protein